MSIIRTHRFDGMMAALGIIMATLCVPYPTIAAVPIVTDSRIKTFVYNENEVFSVLTHYGYQSNIELGSNEEIETVSVGDRVGWQIVPAGRRLFIRAMEENAHTNMTVVTNKRAYQFDLRASAGQALLPSEELVYVVRFYYPDEPSRTPPPPIVSNSDISSINAPAPAMPVPLAAAPIPTAPIPQPVAQTSSSALNYNYTFAGPVQSAPVKIYDDGRATYFKLPPSSDRPQVSVIAASGEEMAIPSSVTPEGLAVVNVIAPRFSIKNNGQRVVVYNETLPGA